MLKINTNELREETWSSPKGEFTGAGKEVSEALGRNRHDAAKAWLCEEDDIGRPGRAEVNE